MVPCVFSQSFVDLGVFWGYPITCCEVKGIERRFLRNVNLSLVVHILLFFISLVDLIRIRLWGRMCDPYSYSTVLLQKYPTLHYQMYQLFFQICFDWLAEVWVSIWISLQYRPLSLSVPRLSLSCASLKFAYKAVIYSACLSTSTVSMYALYPPSISHVELFPLMILSQLLLHSGIHRGL